MRISSFCSHFFYFFLIEHPRLVHPPFCNVNCFRSNLNPILSFPIHQPRRPRQSQSRGGHSQAAHSASSSAQAGTSIPMQASAPPDHMLMTSHPPLPPLPTAQSATQSSHQPVPGIICSNLQVHPVQSTTSFNGLQPNQQLVVSLPPEHRSAAYLPEPPPPYPGHPPSVPPRPTRPAAKSAAVPGPSHGYGEGRGHYNRRSNQQHVPRIG